MVGGLDSTWTSAVSSGIAKVRKLWNNGTTSRTWMRRCAGARGEPGGDPARGGSAAAIVPNTSPLIAADGYFAACNRSLSNGPLSHANTAIFGRALWQAKKAQTPAFC